jgi:hypothetical protein
LFDEKSWFEMALDGISDGVEELLRTFGFGEYVLR